MGPIHKRKMDRSACMGPIHKRKMDCSARMGPIHKRKMDLCARMGPIHKRKMDFSAWMGPIHKRKMDLSNRMSPILYRELDPFIWSKSNPYTKSVCCKKRRRFPFAERLLFSLFKSFALQNWMSELNVKGCLDT